MVFDAKRFVWGWFYGAHFDKKYDVLADEWSNMPDNTVKRLCPTACLVGDHFIYLFGGKSARGVVVPESVPTFERIDTRDPAATWRPVPAN